MGPERVRIGAPPAGHASALLLQLSADSKDDLALQKQELLEQQRIPLEVPVLAKASDADVEAALEEALQAVRVLELSEGSYGLATATSILRLPGPHVPRFLLLLFQEELYFVAGLPALHPRGPYSPRNELQALHCVRVALLGVQINAHGKQTGDNVQQHETESAKCVGDRNAAQAQARRDVRVMLNEEQQRIVRALADRAGQRLRLVGQQASSQPGGSAAFPTGGHTVASGPHAEEPELLVSSALAEAVARSQGVPEAEALAMSPEEELLRWALDQGASTALVPAVFRNTGRGMMAARAVDAGDEVMRVPLPLIISHRTALRSPWVQSVKAGLERLAMLEVSGSAGSSALPSELDEETLVLLWTVAEMRRPASPFRPFFSALPLNEGFRTGLSFGDAAVEALSGTLLKPELLMAQQHLRWQYDELFPALSASAPALFPATLFTWENFLTAAELWYAYGMKLMLPADCSTPSNCADAEDEGSKQLAAEGGLHAGDSTGGDGSREMADGPKGDTGQDDQGAAGAMETTQGETEMLVQCLVPLASLLNHSVYPHITHYGRLDYQGASTSEWNSNSGARGDSSCSPPHKQMPSISRLSLEPALSLRAIRRCAAREQCFLFYGPHASGHQALFYGFISHQPSQPNPYDTFPLDLEEQDEDEAVWSADGGPMEVDDHASADGEGAAELMEEGQQSNNPPSSEKPVESDALCSTGEEGQLDIRPGSISHTGDHNDMGPGEEGACVVGRLRDGGTGKDEAQDGEEGDQEDQAQSSQGRGDSMLVQLLRLMLCRRLDLEPSGGVHFLRLCGAHLDPDTLLLTPSCPQGPASQLTGRARRDLGVQGTEGYREEGSRQCREQEKGGEVRGFRENVGDNGAAACPRCQAWGGIPAQLLLSLCVASMSEEQLRAHLSNQPQAQEHAEGSGPHVNADGKSGDEGAAESLSYAAKLSQVSAECRAAALQSLLVTVQALLESMWGEGAEESGGLYGAGDKLSVISDADWDVRLALAYKDSQWQLLRSAAAELFRLKEHAD